MDEGDRGTKPPARSDMIAFNSGSSTRSSIIKGKYGRNKRNRKVMSKVANGRPRSKPRHFWVAASQARRQSRRDEQARVHAFLTGNKHNKHFISYS